MKTRDQPSPAAVRLLLRELSGQLAQLNHRVGSHAKLKDGDLASLDILARQGPMGPTELARAMHLHPATMTGVLDRLESDGWIVRERDSVDRRAVRVRAVGGRVRELMELYAGMNGAIERIAESYDAAELAVIAGFLSRIIEAGRGANDALAAD
jgi:DNA-binding MarR family transcriptional regulator